MNNLPVNTLASYRIVCTRYTIKPLDPFDNLPSSFKPIIDALTEYRIIEDDKWGMGDQISAKQVKVSKKKDQKITIEIEEIPDAKKAVGILFHGAKQ